MLTVEVAAFAPDNRFVGALSWVVAGVVALLLARWIPIGFVRHPVLEATVSLLAAIAFGAAATALDFGGWAEADWRAALFALLGSFGAIGAARLGRQSSRR